MHTALRAATLGWMIAAGSVAWAAPGRSTSTTVTATSLPQSSADLVARLFADRGGSSGRAARGETSDAFEVEAGLLSQVGGKASAMVSTAMDFIGVPYRRGGATVDSGFDCSGFTRRVFESSIGLLLPRRANEQARAAGLKPVGRDGLQPGDLVFFNTLRHTFSHVGIYLGDHKFIHSPSVGGEVRVDDMRFAYWSNRFTGARRADLRADPAGEPGNTSNP